MTPAAPAGKAPPARVSMLAAMTSRTLQRGAPHTRNGRWVRSQGAALVAAVAFAVRVHSKGASEQVDAPGKEVAHDAASFSIDAKERMTLRSAASYAARSLMMNAVPYALAWFVLHRLRWFPSFKFNPRYDSVPGLFRKELRRWLVCSLLGIAQDLLTRLAMERGYLPSLKGGIDGALLKFALAAYWEEVHFYVMHRIMHSDWLYKNVHSVHHQSFNPNPFSGLSFHPIEGMAYFSALPLYVMLHAAAGVELNSFAYMGLKALLDIGPLFGHSGFGGPLGHAGQHYLHHTKRHGNFGAGTLLDKPFGTRLPKQSPYGSKWIGS